ncbi:FMN-binding negative transcriptional regulator [Pseudoduganella ginsengisoli]|uniref:FMN-binding negative transcriptional regulator n=1 Tax=Pseudoduganella ginsengisoli TaxID=1462440 RepID=A0A6L6Q1W2_9BURK|nr:FMN-binding negative transcriptional regulator [Pseudoduganella ginsengisoli]MTW03843.1 FMN-binding negative transcriptional regulator [Pseudoduganella ginsengisoli]
MYCQPQFKQDRLDLQHDLIRSYPLGMLVVASPSGVTADLLPFMLYADEGECGVLRAHAPRANPVCGALLEGAECLVVFQGPDAYVSPSWYASKAETHKVVPTWNFTMVQARGNARLVDDAAWLRRQLDDLTDFKEARLPQPWKVSDAPADFIAAVTRAIVGIEIPIASIAGKWKTSQNRSSADRASVVEGLQQHGENEMAALVAATLA